MKKNKKRFVVLVLALILSALPLFSLTASAVPHTVIKGESLWLIAKKYQVGLSEIIAANPQILILTLYILSR